MKRCSFCGVEETRLTPVIEGAAATICESCAEASVESLRGRKKIRKTGLLRPYELKAELDQYVIGQEDAKKALSVAAYNHYKRIYSEKGHPVDIQKSNVLVWGPSGSGKTYLIQTLASLLDVPFVIADATVFTKAGYIGDDVETMIQQLLERADGNVEQAERGILYIDEIDKIARDVGGRDPGGRAVQESLLKMMEDRDVSVPMGPHAPNKVINTKNILFIFGGAFVGLGQEKDSAAKSRIGFLGSTGPSQEEMTEITHEDLIDYGLIPEFVGRIPMIARLSGLKKENLVEILIKPKNAVLKQYQALFEMDGIRLSFSPDAVDYIAEEAMKKETGARGLKGIIEKKIMQLMFELPGRDEEIQVVVTAGMLKGEEDIRPADENGEKPENLSRAV